MYTNAHYVQLITTNPKPTYYSGYIKITHAAGFSNKHFGQLVPTLPTNTSRMSLSVMLLMNKADEAFNVSPQSTAHTVQEASKDNERMVPFMRQKHIM